MLKKKRRLIGLALVALGLLGLTTVSDIPRNLALSLISPSYGGVQLTPVEIQAAVSDGEIVLVDVRRPDEWRATGVAVGAVPLDLRRDDFVEALSTTVGNDLRRPVALICARGVRSARVAQQLSEAGFTNIIDVPEGMLGSAAGPGWLARGLPITRDQ